MSDRSRWTIPGLLCVLAAAPAVLVALLGKTMVMPPAGVHFGVGLAGAGLAAVAAATLTLAGRRSVDGRAMLLGIAFSTMTALLGVHAMATPGVLIGPNGVIAFAGGLGIPVGTALLALTALPALRRTRNVKPLMILQVVLGGAVLGLAAVALVATLVIGPMTLGYYLGHALELAAVGMIAIPAARDIARTGASFPLVGDLTATDLVASEEAYLGPRVRALMVRLAERDGSTEEHTRRVAILAAQVGEELKLPATARRHLAVGGLLHDIGKLSVPLEILRKPSGLTDEEYAAIKRHPEAGRRLLEELGGFSPTVLDLVSDHHERLDGRGYPRGLTEDELPLHTRILTVCDVYDALVSHRVYRAARTPERAFELLRDDAGSAFDERCVKALARVVGLAPAPGWVADVAPAPLRAPGLPGSLRPAG